MRSIVEYTKTTVIGCVLVLMPIFLSVLLLLEAFDGVLGPFTPIAEGLPPTLPIRDELPAGSPQSSRAAEGGPARRPLAPVDPRTAEAPAVGRGRWPILPPMRRPDIQPRSLGSRRDGPEPSSAPV